MKKVIELLFNAKTKDSAITLYFPGTEFTGIIEDITDQEIIALKCGNRNIFLDSTSLIGFTQPLQEQTGMDMYHEETSYDQEENDSYEEEILSFEEKINTAQRPSGSVLELIKKNVRERVWNYPDIELEIENMILQMENHVLEGIDEEILLRLEELKVEKPGCSSALNTLSAGFHYVGGNKEKAIEILWSAGRFEIALLIIDEILDDWIYLDCLGYVVSDLNAEYEKFLLKAFFYYVQKCAELQDVSLLSTIIEAAFMNGQDADGLYQKVLYFLIRKKEHTVVTEVNRNESILILLRRVKELYPGNGLLLERQNTFQKRLDNLFANAPVQIIEKKEELKYVVYNNEEPEMQRPKYYIGRIDEDFIYENVHQFRVKLDLNQTQRIYMHPYQIADPLLLHRLNTGRNVVGTKICFRFGQNDKGICVADAVMTGAERTAYRESLYENRKEDYNMPDYFNYIANVYDEADLLLYGKDLLEQSADEAQKENIDQVELIIFFYNFIMNRNSWPGMGYPRVIQNCPDIIEFLQNYNSGYDDNQVYWANEFMQFLKKTGHKDWADLFQSVREGLSKSNPFYIKSKIDPSVISPEELQDSYIFPESANGNYESALNYIQHWKNKKKRKSRGNLWDRMCKLEEVCRAGLDENQEEFTNRASELLDLVTNNQKNSLRLLFIKAGLDMEV